MTQSTISAHLPSPCNSSRAACEQVAREVRNISGEQRIDRVLDALGGKVEISAPGADGPLIVVRGPQDFTIYVSSITSRDRRAVTKATALGHYVLHYPRVLDEYPGDSLRVPSASQEPFDTPERARFEALWFAYELLAPSAEVPGAIAARGLNDAASEFGVPRQFLHARAIPLGLDLTGEVRQSA